MSKRMIPVALFLGLALAIAVTGCQSQPQATPEPTATENVVVVVITATPQPTLETTQVSEPTITPLATFTPIGTIDTTATSPATATRKLSTVVPGTPKPVKTNTLAAIVAPPTAAPKYKYTAPISLRPSSAFNDRVDDGKDIQLQFQSVGSLGTNECYAVHVTMINPNATPPTSASATFFDPLFESHCGNSSGAGTLVTFTVSRPKFQNKPNYGSIERVQNDGNTSLLNVHWYVTVVQNNGLQSDGVHYNLVPLSPPSATLEFDFGV